MRLGSIYDYQCNAGHSALACTRTNTYACVLYTPSSVAIYTLENTIHYTGIRASFVQVAHVATNNKQWPAAEIACPTCATPRQPLPSLVRKDRRLSIWHVARRFPCTTNSLLADFSFFFLWFFLALFRSKLKLISMLIFVTSLYMILICIKKITITYNLISLSWWSFVWKLQCLRVYVFHFDNGKLMQKLLH